MNSTSRHPLTPEEFRALIGPSRIGRSTLYDALRRGEIQHARIGRKILIAPTEADRFLGLLGETASGDCRGPR